MTAKKKLITRMAMACGGIIVLALLVGGVTLVRMETSRRRFEDEQKRAREETVERSRRYLAEVAKRIAKLPVDPTLVGEIESRYFEERASGPVHVWATGTTGELLFGVPREAFSRLSAIYDREIVPKLKEGVFLDRQSFLLDHLGETDAMDLPEVLSEKPEEGGEMWTRLRGHDHDDEGFVLSAPLKTEEGTALGNLYLKRAWGERANFNERAFEPFLSVAGGFAGLSVAFLWVLLPTWVYVDARERGVRRAPLFAFLTVLSSLIGLVVYLIARPEDARTLACPGCGKEVNGGAFCPHCGRDLSSSFCPACRYPLKPDWAFCPSCRAEIKPPAAPPAPASSGA